MVGKGGSHHLLQVVASTFAQHLAPLKVVAEGGGHYLCLKGGGQRWCPPTLKVVANPVTFIIILEEDIVAKELQV